MICSDFQFDADEKTFTLLRGKVITEGLCSLPFGLDEGLSNAHDVFNSIPGMMVEIIIDRERD